MRRYIDNRKVKRMATLGTAGLVIGVLSMLVGLALSFLARENAPLVLSTSFMGVIIAQLGLTQRSRWGGHPRTDETLDDSLKGLDERYAVFHYLLGASHALICPSGIYAVCTTTLEGEISYQDGQWQHTPPSRRSRPSKPRSLGQPDRETTAEVERLRKALTKHLGAEPEERIRPLLVFLHPNARVEDIDAPYRALHAKKLKAYLRSLAKSPTLPPDKVEALARTLKVEPAD
jgi:hypothetical protein